MDALVAFIGWVSAILGVIALAIGLTTAWKRRNDAPPEPTETTGLAEQGGGAVNEAIKNVSDFAKALKDLDRSGQLMTIGVLLIAIAAITAGLDNVAEAIEKAVTSD